MLCVGHQDDPMARTEGRVRLGWDLVGLAAKRLQVLLLAWWFSQEWRWRGRVGRDGAAITLLRMRV